MSIKYFRYLTVVIVIFAGLGVMLSPSVSAYYYNDYKWSSANATYLINQTWASWYGTSPITSAALAWSQAGGAFSFIYGGTTSLNPNTYDDLNYQLDEYNAFGYTDAGNTGSIARTAISRSQATPDTIIEVDTTFNINSSNPFSNNGDPNSYDIQSVTTHEFGHWLSLGHTQWNYCWPWLNTSIAATMCSANIFVGETWAQTLEQDDIDGIKYIYPYHAVSGTISQNTTWLQNRVYVVQGEVTVEPGVTLTIEPGAVIKFDYSSLTVNGTLSAQGTSQNKIYFTSYYDDSVGGDTDGDPWRSPQAGDWSYIKFTSGSQGNLSNTVVRYAGDYYGYGIYNNGGAINISESEIAYNQSRGLYIDNGSAIVTETNFHDNSTHGVYAATWYGPTTLTLNNNTFTTTENSVAAEVDASVDFTHANNTASGTGWNGFKMFGFMSANRAWLADNMPYIVYDVFVPEFTTLTIDPGAIVKMAGYIDVQGALHANGLPENKIYFTSICDDSIGGDTDGRSCFEWEYGWMPIWLSYLSAANFSNAVFRYGGGWEDGVISAAAATLTLIDNTFTNNNAVARLNAHVNFTHSGNTASNNAKNGFEIYGAIDNNQTWNADLPYIIKNIDVWGNLTLNPGVIMKFSHNEDEYYNNGLTVNGILNATGTATSTIFFTSIKDDEPGGDTNGDGSATTPAPGDWRPIKFAFGSQGALSYAKVSYGGMYDWTICCVGSNPAVYNNGGTLSISNSQIEKTAQWDGSGIVQGNGSLTIASSEFNNQYIGVSVQGGIASILQNNFHDNSYGFGAGNENVSALTLNNNTFTNNSLAAAFINASINFTHSGNIATGSGKRGFLMSGWITQNRTWTAGDLPYIVSEGITIDSGATLTIQPGVVIKLCTSNCLPWSWSPAGISVLGVLQANGTSENKISFTSIKDDDIGGDTNGDGPSSGAPRDWDSVSFWPGSQGNFSNAIIRYGGGGYNDDGAISTYNYGGGTINISDSQIDHNGTYGIYHTNGSLRVTGTELHDHSYGIYNSGTLSVSNSKIFNNTSYGIYNSGTLTLTNSELFNQEYGLYIDNGEASVSQNNFHDNSTYGLYNNVAWLPGVNAENNYWGSPSGPYHPYWNPNGTGNPVSDYVDFDPWLTQWP